MSTRCEEDKGQVSQIEGYQILHFKPELVLEGSCWHPVKMP
jgi:hypothetical protein